MLPKNRRVRVQAYANTRAVSVRRSPAFTAKRFPSATPHARFGLVVGKAAARTAVARNRTRRRICAALAERFLDIAPADYLIIANASAVAMSVSRIAEELKKVL